MMITSPSKIFTIMNLVSNMEIRGINYDRIR